jgi:hypothetical protein
VQAQINVISVTASQTCGNKTNKQVRNPILLTFCFYSKEVYRQADIQPYYLHSLGELSIQKSVHGQSFFPCVGHFITD